MNEKINVGDVLVASWGYSMVLTTWVRVTKVSPKTLLVVEVRQRSLNQEELEQHGLKPGYLQNYSVPVMDELRPDVFGNPRPQFRLYPDKKFEGRWHGYPDGMATQLQFKKWDGRPAFEDHCD